MKKIVFLMTGLEMGGAEKFAISLANRLNAKEFQVKIVSLSNNNPLKAELREHVGLTLLQRHGKFDVRPLLKLRKLIRKENPHLLFCVGPFPYFFVTCAILFAAEKAKILSYHTTIPLNKKTDYLYKLYFKLLKKKDVIITVSKNQEIYTSKKYDIASARFKTIHNGIDQTYWKPQDKDFSVENFRAKFRIPTASKVIILAATLRPEKNHIGAIDALSILHDKYNLKAHLLFIGDGPMLEHLKLHAANLNLSCHITFAGQQNDVRPFYWISNLFTLCSSKVETFSIAALEAMACGLPAVLTNIGGASEMIFNDINGLLCSPDKDDISKKWNKAFNTKYDKDKISEFVHHNFNQTDMIRKYEMLFNSIEE